MKILELVEDWKTWSASANRWCDGWESDFPDWHNEVIPTIIQILQGPIGELESNAILFFLGRDDECEGVLKLIKRYSIHGEALATGAIRHSDTRVRWQIAVALGGIGAENALNALAEMLEDECEYVRRRALLSIREHRPEIAHKVAQSWMNSEYEYSRMVAIDTIAKIEPTDLPGAIIRLKNDPSQIVQNRMRELEQEAKKEARPQNTLADP